jgi:hypothetical protein
MASPRDAFPGPVAGRRTECNVLNRPSWAGQMMCRLCGPEDNLAAQRAWPQCQRLECTTPTVIMTYTIDHDLIVRCMSQSRVWADTRSADRDRCSIDPKIWLERACKPSSPVSNHSCKVEPLSGKSVVQLGWFVPVEFYLIFVIYIKAPSRVIEQDFKDVQSSSSQWTIILTRMSFSVSTASGPHSHIHIYGQGTWQEILSGTTLRVSVHGRTPNIILASCLDVPGSTLCQDQGLLHNICSWGGEGRKRNKRRHLCVLLHFVWRRWSTRFPWCCYINMTSSGVVLISPEPLCCRIVSYA